MKSLETRDPVKAAARAQQAIEELEKEAAAENGQSRWRADMPVKVWDVPHGMEMTIENLDKHGFERETTWDQVANHEDEILRPKATDWLDLVREAESVLKRKHKKTYSASWHRNVAIAIRQCPFTLQEASPVTIRGWIKSMEAEGKSGLTINSKCSLLSGLVDTCIKSGLLAGQTNPFNLVDYTAGEANHIPPAEEQDYRGLKELVPTLDVRFQLPILIQAYTGCRISEVRKRKAEDFDLEAGTMEVVVGTAKNKASERVIPLPPVVVDLLRGFDYRWPTEPYINDQIRTINPELSSHSFRHGLTKLGRDLQSNEIAIEAMLGHRLSHSDMANRYGGKYGAEAMRKAVAPVWEQLDEWVGPVK